VKTSGTAWTSAWSAIVRRMAGVIARRDDFDQLYSNSNRSD